MSSYFGVGIQHLKKGAKYLTTLVSNFIKKSLDCMLMHTAEQTVTSILGLHVTS